MSNQNVLGTIKTDFHYKMKKTPKFCNSPTYLFSGLTQNDTPGQETIHMALLLKSCSNLKSVTSAI